jgi:putative oxidoreductase
VTSAAGGFLRSHAALRVTRFALGALLLAAALAKIGDATGLALQVHNYRLAPGWSENLVAILLPWVELCTGLALVLGIRARAGAVIGLSLMVAFTIAVGSAWARGLDFECGCFGKASASHVGAEKFVENLGLTALATLASLRRRD